MRKLKSSQAEKITSWDVNMTIWHVDSMTKVTKCCQRYQKRQKKSCQKLANIAKLCQMLPNDANRYLKWSTTKTKILQQVVKIKIPTSFKPLANIGTILQKELINIAENWQKVANSAKSSQKLPKVSNCWHKLSKAAKICQKLATRHDDMVT